MGSPAVNRSAVAGVMAAAMLFASGCSDTGSDAVGDPVAAEEVAAVAVTEAPAIRDEGGSDLPEFDDAAAAEVVEQLDTEEGRELFIEQMIDLLGISREDAECFLDNTPPEALDAVGTGGMDNEQMAILFEILQECDIDLDAVLGGLE